MGRILCRPLLSDLLGQQEVMRLDKIEVALKAARAKGFQIRGGPSAFDWTSSPLICSGFGALILYYNLRDGPNPPGLLARTGWVKFLTKELKINGWWLRRFYCGFELGRSVYVKTEKKTNVFFVDHKGKKSYYKEDDVSKESIKLRKRYSNG